MRRPRIVRANELWRHKGRFMPFGRNATIGGAFHNYRDKTNTTEAVMKPGETPSRVLIYLTLFGLSVVLLFLQLT